MRRFIWNIQYARLLRRYVRWARWRSAWAAAKAADDWYLWGDTPLEAVRNELACWGD